MMAMALSAPHSHHEDWGKEYSCLFIGFHREIFSKFDLLIDAATNKASAAMMGRTDHHCLTA